MKVTRTAIIVLGVITLITAATLPFLLPALTKARAYSGPGVQGNLLTLEVTKARWWDEHKGGKAWPTEADLLPYLRTTNFDRAIRPRHNEIYIINKTGAPVYAYFPKASVADCLMTLDSNKLSMIEKLK